MNRRDRRKEAKEAKLQELGNGVEDPKIIYDIMEGKMALGEFLLKREIDPNANSKGLHKCTWTIVCVPRDFLFARSPEGTDTAHPFVSKCLADLQMSTLQSKLDTIKSELQKAKAELSQQSEVSGSKSSRSRKGGKGTAVTTASGQLSGLENSAPEPEVASTDSEDLCIQLRSLRRGHHTYPSVRGQVGEVLRPKKLANLDRLVISQSGQQGSGVQQCTDRDRERFSAAAETKKRETRTVTHSERIQNAAAASPSPQVVAQQVSRTTLFKHPAAASVAPTTALPQDTIHAVGTAPGPSAGPSQGTPTPPTFDGRVQPQQRYAPPELPVSSHNQKMGMSTTTTVHPYQHQPAEIYPPTRERPPMVPTQSQAYTTVSGHERTFPPTPAQQQLNYQLLPSTNERHQPYPQAAATYQPPVANHQPPVAVQQQQQQQEIPVSSVPLSLLSAIEVGVPYLTIQPHVPVDNREIPLVCGEYVTVHRILESGWCFATAVSQVGDTRTGWIPYFVIGPRASA
uniref:SH3 domain-containing protein n=1 Tax=Chromera velia CCMP2878 TaxID=1169474 RepID=A0A0G4FV46_9ALVE|eukprot:Cvel_3786.t1-p1 / transcript=Cvel_3786.t1 / gene=Cvel_3786 / organism=Chromera_velia_CCMP2878 / gene_product=hypothetical protein / transcript_product=hypothetical protein / location=Cvel_scaffold159:24734-27043(+) / protein_length=512 / sequence_SO=supercontig / SO=protein_coding / is_pseudo=false